jgi:hypothetical protein
MTSALQGLLSLIQLIGLYFVPESPRWIVSKNRSDEALASLAKYHGEGDDTDALVVFEFNENVMIPRQEEKMQRENRTIPLLLKPKVRVLFLCCRCSEIDDKPRRSMQHAAEIDNKTSKSESRIPV